MAVLSSTSTSGLVVAWDWGIATSFNGGMHLMPHGINTDIGVKATNAQIFAPQLDTASAYGAELISSATLYAPQLFWNPLQVDPYASGYLIANAGDAIHDSGCFYGNTFGSGYVNFRSGGTGAVLDGGTFGNTISLVNTNVENCYSGALVQDSTSPGPVVSTGFLKVSIAGSPGSTGTVDLTPPFPYAATITAANLGITGSTPAGCSTYMIVGLWDYTDSTAIGSYTLSSGNSGGALILTKTSVAAGDQLGFRVITAPSGCSTNASYLNINVFYR
jgi:hypothetical protein